MEETGNNTPKPTKKIRLTRSEAYAMRISSPRKKRVAFGLVALLVAVILGNVLWHFQDLWLSYWLPEPEPATLVSTPAPEGQPAPEPAPATTPEMPAPALGPELDFLSAAVWDDPQFLQGVRLFNRALDRYRLFARDRFQRALLPQIEDGATQAAQLFEPLRPAAPAAVPLGDYIARCGKLVAEARRLARPAPAPATAPPAKPAAPATPDVVVPPHRPGQPWQHPDYLEGARLFNQALAQYKLFLANKSRTELLKPIEEDAFLAAKKFESLKGQAPDDVPLADHITQCYKLISDCRRQHLEGANAEPETPFDRSTTGPSRRPALPAYQPPQPTP